MCSLTLHFVKQQIHHTLIFNSLCGRVMSPRVVDGTLWSKTLLASVTEPRAAQPQGSYWPAHQWFDRTHLVNRVYRISSCWACVLFTHTHLCTYTPTHLHTHTHAECMARPCILIRLGFLVVVCIPKSIDCVINNSRPSCLLLGQHVTTQRKNHRQIVVSCHIWIIRWWCSAFVNHTSSVRPVYEPNYISGVAVVVVYCCGDGDALHCMM